MPFLGDQTLGDIPIIHNWEFADATARAVATDPHTGVAYLASDLGKVCKQSDTLAYYTLEAITPTWRPLGITAISGDVAVSATGVATVTDLTIASEAQGDVLYRNATNWVRLAKGTASQVLAMNSGATAPEWVTPSAGGATPIGFLIPGGLYVGTNILKIGWKSAFTIGSIYTQVGTAPTDASLTVDVTYHATDPTSKTTIFTTGPLTNVPTIATTEFASTGGVPDVTSLAANSFVGISILQVGSTIPGSDLTVWFVPA